MKLLNKLISTIFIVIAIVACTQIQEKPIDQLKSNAKKIEESTTKTTEKINNCICPQMWMPVCGENGKTYSNSCFAKCANINFTQGSCEKNLDE